MLKKSFNSFSTIKNLRTFSTENSEFYHKNQQVTYNDKPKTPSFEPENLIFGKTTTNHMLRIEYDSEKWCKPEIYPYQHINIDPFNSTLHYAITCYEGMKAYKGVDNKIRLMRPMDNMARLTTSMARLGMIAPWDDEELLKCMNEQIKIEKNWIPSELGQSLYIRPFAISNTHSIGVTYPRKYAIYCVLNPVGSYFGLKMKPVNIATIDSFERARPKSAGRWKLGANYAPAVEPMVELNKIGYHQCLWTYDDIISEVGACNVFFVVKNDNGQKELITPMLDGSLLPGLTRKTVLELIQADIDENGPDNAIVSKVTERQIRMTEMVKLIDEGKLVEFFGSGTAVTILPIQKLLHEGVERKLPISEDNIGDVTSWVYNKIVGIQYGKEQHPLQYVVE